MVLNTDQVRFLLAKLLVDSLACKTTPKAFRKALAAASDEDDTYAYFYEEALERIRVQPPSHVQLANQVLSWIVFAMRPLKMIELQHALAVEEDEPEIDEDNIPSAEIMISACAELVTLDEEDGIIRLVHQTTQEFFNSRKHALFKNVDTQIAFTCVCYLSLGQVRGSIIRLVRRPNIRRDKDPFCEYAVLHWGHHAGYCDTIPANVIGLLKNREMLQLLATVLSELLGENVPSAAAHLAAWFGLLQVFKTQALPTDSLDFVDHEGESILSWAVHRKHYDLAEHILEDDTLQLKSFYHQGKARSFLSALCKAAMQSNSDLSYRLIRFAIDESFGLGSADGSSLLCWGIHKGDVTMIRLLLDWSRHRPSFTQNSTFTQALRIPKPSKFSGKPLVLAAWIGFDEAVKLLLDHGANIDTPDDDRDSSLLQAAQEGHISTVKILLQYGAKSFSRLGGQLAICSVQQNGHVSIVELLIMNGICIESKNERGMTLLSSAAGAGQLPMVVMLLSHNADIEARDKKGYTPLWHGFMNWQQSTFEMLLKRGANAETMDEHGNTLLHFAVKDDATSMLEILLRYKAMIEAKNPEGRTALSIAAEIHNSSAFVLLLQLGAVVEALDEKNRTPLWYAAAAGSILNVEMLKESGADINHGDIADVTPIMIAAESGRGLMLERLVKLGANLTVHDKFGRTALSIAAGANCNSILSTDDLKEKFKQSWSSSSSVDGAILPSISEFRQLVDVRDYQGRTPLWWAIASGRTEILEHLSKEVDEVEVLDKQGRPPLINSADSHHIRKVVQLLL